VLLQHHRALTTTITTALSIGPTEADGVSGTIAHQITSGY